VLFHFLMKARLDVDRFCIQHGNAQFAGQSLCPSREHNLVLGIDRRSSTYHTENGPVHAENQYVYVENLHRDTRLVFVSALAFGKKPLRPPEFKLVGDPFEQDRFAVEVVRGRSTARVEFDLKKGTVRSAGRRQPY